MSTSLPKHGVTDPSSFTPPAKGTRNYGILAGCGAHMFWGFSVLFWPLFRDLPAVSLLSHRMLWSCAFLLIVVSLTRQWPDVIAAFRDKKTFAILAASGAMLSCNWGLYLWAVNNGNIVECSLGYYITPLINLVMGRVLLGEKVTPLQALAIFLVIIGVGWGIFKFGHVPWLGLVLATTFAIYGYLKKTIRVDPVPSLFIEITILSPVAFLWLAYAHPGNFGMLGQGPVRVMQLACTALFTGLPLLMFSYAAKHIRLSTIGILQYLSPSINFILAVTLLGEEIKPSDMITFPILWAALIIYTWDAWRNMRKIQKRS